MAKIKIVHVITRLIKGGAQKICLDITEGLPKNVYEVFIVSGPETGLEGSLWDKIRQIHDVKVKVIPELAREISPAKDLTALIKLYYFLCETQPHIIHCHTSKAGFIGCLAGWLARVPVIIYAPYGHLFSPTAMIPSVSHSTLRMRLFYYLTKLSCLLSAKVIAQNSADRDEQVKLRLAPAGKFGVIHNSVEVRPLSQTGSGSKRYPLLATVGRLSAEKGQVYLLEALKSVRNEFPDTQLLVIGDGVLRKELKTFVEKENLNNNVRFTGLCDDPSQLLKDIDIFVLPSLYESFGIVLLEAMAQGKPAIASNVNGIPGVVVNGETGILVPPANPKELSEAIIKLANDKELARKMGAAGYERVNKLFRKEQMVADFDNLYKRTVEKTLSMSLRATAKQSHSVNEIATPGGLAMTPEINPTAIITTIPSGLSIAPAQKPDLPILAAMHIEPSITKVKEIIQGRTGAYQFYLDKVRMFHAIEPNGILVTKEGGQITGFIITSSKPDGIKMQALKKGYALLFSLKAMFLQYGINKDMLKKLFMVPYANLTGQRISSPSLPRDKRASKIWAFIIMKEARRQGLGVKLIDAACDYATKHNANIIFVTVAKDNLPALNLYQKTGFRISGECLESTGPSYYLTRPLFHSRPDCLPAEASAQAGHSRPTRYVIPAKAGIQCGGINSGGNPVWQDIKQANRSVYNAKTVAQYEENPSIFEPARQAEIKNIVSFISAKTNKGIYLDVGCGTGNVLKIARQHFGLAIGVDIAEKFLKEVKKLHPELDLIAADSNRLPFKNNAFNCVSLYGTLHHLFNPAQTLAGISALIKPDGYLYTDHDPNYFFGRFYHIYYRMRHRRPGFGSRQEEMAEFHNTQTGGINPESLKKKLLNSGFHDVQVHYRHTTNPTLPLLERLGLALLKASARLVPLRSFYTHFYIIGRR